MASYKVIFAPQAESDYRQWEKSHPKIFDRINQLIKNIAENPLHPGIGKHELLRGNLSGWRSCRITQEDRLVYRVKNYTIEIASCKRHY